MGKKKFLILFSLITIIWFFVAGPNIAKADCTPGTTGCYKLLSPLPGLGTQVGTSTYVDIGSNSNPLSSYVLYIIRLGIGIMAVLAVIMIVVGGIQYMLAASGGEKNGGKDRITNAIFGLALALSSYLILNTLNPNLVNLKVNLPNVSFTMQELTQDPGDDGDGGVTPTKNPDGTYTAPNAGNVAVCDPSAMVTISQAELDQGMGVVTNGATVNAAVKDSLIKAFSDYKAALNGKPSLKSYKITSGGGYNCRGNRNAAKKWSAHAYGLAIDLNPNTNKNIPGQKTPLTSSQYDLPPELIAAFKQEGWGWGGDFSTLKDPMHFSKLVREHASGPDSFNI